MGLVVEEGMTFVSFNLFVPLFLPAVFASILLSFNFVELASECESASESSAFFLASILWSFNFFELNLSSVSSSSSSTSFLVVILLLLRLVLEEDLVSEEDTTFVSSKNLFVALFPFGCLCQYPPELQLRRAGVGM